jgi:Xaa-Pro dipeptidase
VTRTDEIAVKEQRVREWLDRRGFAALLISRQNNFAWLTGGGDNHVVIAGDLGSSSLLITRDAKHLVCDNIEAGRAMEEELVGLGYQRDEFPWYQGTLAAAVERLAPTGLAADTPIGGASVVDAELAALRYRLLPSEVERYRWVGARCGQAMATVARAVKPGMTEHQMAGALAEELFGEGIVPTVLLVAADDRAFKYRHPIPTEAKLDRHLMLVACGRRWGLIVSLTRMVHFGELPAELRRKHQAVAQVDATFIAHTRPGARTGDIFQAAVDCYAATGFGDEWQLHHQGGATGYAGRDYKATAASDQTVEPAQAFAWNPSIAGTKSEDTIIALEGGTEIISASPDWPMLEITVGDGRWPRPDIVIR